MFVTKYVAHLLQQTPELGKTGDGVHGIKNMHKTTELVSKNKLSIGLLGIGLSGEARQLIPSDILGFQSIRPPTSR